MKILYVTPLWSGLRDLLEGAKVSKGMPAFVNPLRRLIESGHVVDLIVVDKDPEKIVIDIQVEWLKMSKIFFSKWNTNGLQKILSVIKLFYVINKFLAFNKYDFVYCHGSIGAIANLSANLHRVPCGARLYGTFLSSEIDNSSKIRIALRHPLEYAVFKFPKDFLLVTNDGTKGDKVYNYLRNKKKLYDFYFKLNGVSFSEFDNNGNINKFFEEPFLFYPARIARWKQQHLAIDIAKELNAKGLNIHLYIAGHITDKDYWNEINEKINFYNLNSHVTYLGVIDKSIMYYLYENALAVLSLYQFSNLGNVVIEALSCGGIMISINDGSLNNIIKDRESGILIRDIDEAVEEIVSLFNDPTKALNIKKSAKQRAREIFRDWNERVEEEILLIENAVYKKWKKDDSKNKFYV